MSVAIVVESASEVMATMNRGSLKNSLNNNGEWAGIT